MQALARNRQMARAEVLLDQMLARGVRLTLVTFNMLLGMYGKAGQWERAAEGFDAMTQYQVRRLSATRTRQALQPPRLVADLSLGHRSSSSTIQERRSARPPLANVRAFTIPSVHRKTSAVSGTSKRLSVSLPLA